MSLLCIFLVSPSLLALFLLLYAVIDQDDVEREIGEMMERWRER